MDTFAAINVTTQLLGLVIQGLAALLLGGLGFVVTRGFKAAAKAWTSIHLRLDHLDGCVDEVKEAQKAQVTEVADLRADLREQNTRYADLREELAYLKGQVGAPLKKPVETLEGTLA